MKIPMFGFRMTLALCFFSVVAMAQIPVLKDPLKVPHLWKELEKRPTDMVLWRQYYGKNSAEMKPSDYEKIQEWKQVLMLKLLAEEESIVGFRLETTTAGFFIDDFAFTELMGLIESTRAAAAAPKASVSKNDPTVKHIKKTQFAGMEVSIITEHATLNELKKNVNENFALIEDIYSELFKQFDTVYVYYEKAVPNGKIHQTDWVLQQDKRLKELKQKQLEKLYASITD